MESRFVDVCGQRLHARVHGTGPDILLLHGVLASHRYWEPFIRAIAGRARCWALDLPGHGRSEDAPAMPAAARADLVADWMVQVGLAEAHVVANSSGCRVAAALAARHPHLVRRLVLQGVVEPRRMPVEAWRWLASIVREPRLPLRAALQDLRKQGLRQPLAERRCDHEDRLEAWLADVRAPTLLVRGRRDRLMPRPWCARIAGILADAEVATLPGAHILHATQPAMLIAVVAPFFGLIDPAVAAGTVRRHGEDL